MDGLIEFSANVIELILAFVPIFICSALNKFIKEQKRHNQATEVRLDFIAKELRKITEQG